MLRTGLREAIISSNLKPRTALLGLVGAIVLGVVIAARWSYTIAFVSDDAWISFRYAWNLAHGNGLSWNPGLEPVEGYSNLLWTLWSALGIALGLPVGRFAVASGVAFAYASAVGAGGCARAAGAGLVPSFAAALLMAASPLMGRWMGLGLETPMFTMLLTLGVWRAIVELNAARAGQRLGPWSALAFGLAFLCRAEGPLYLAIPLVFTLSRGRLLGWKDLRDLALAATPVSLQLLARIAVYGELVPNTARAKVGGNLIVEGLSGLRYLGAGLSYNPLLSVTVALGVAGLLFGARRAAPLLAPFLVCAVFSVLVGGDQFSDLRFLIPAIPSALAAAALGWSVWSRRAGRLAPLVLILGLGLSTAALFNEVRTTSVNVARAPARDRVIPAPGQPMELPWEQLSLPMAEVRRGPLWGLARPLPPQQIQTVHWFYAYLIESLKPGDVFFFLEVGLIGYALVDSPMLDGRGLNWRTATELSRSMMPGNTWEERLAVQEKYLAVFEAHRPAIVFLQCDETGYSGPAEEVLLTSDYFFNNYTFVAWGPYFANKQICVFRREGAERPTAREIIARYQRLERDAPDELDWGDRRSGIERGRARPVEVQYGNAAPPWVVSRR